MDPMNDEDLRGALRDRGQRATTQRLVLLRALHELGRHVTADELLRAAHDRLPALSLPTVYATLELFEGLGLVRRIAAGQGPALFDPVLDGHAHLRCHRCARVVDLPSTLDLARVMDEATHAGHAPSSAEVVISGVCDRCAATQASSLGAHVA